MSDRRRYRSDDAASNLHREFSSGETESPAPVTVRRPRNRNRSSRPEWQPKDWIDKIAVYWVEVGEKTLDRRPPVNTEKFAARIRDAIRADKRMAWGLLDDFEAPGKPSDVKGWERGEAYLHDLLVRMVEIYWEDIETDVSPQSYQFQFAQDYWDELQYLARDSIRLRRLKTRPVRREPIGYSQTQHDAYWAYQERLKADRIKRWTEEQIALKDTPSIVATPEGDRRLHEWRDRIAAEREETTDD